MKFLTIILSFYFLALNVVPCGDSGKAKDDAQVVSVMDYDGNHDQDCELCSPFCQCHCCHVHTIDFDIAEFQPLQSVISQENFAYFDSLGKDFALSLYQPPQV
ncbi:MULTISPECIES: DUF6660 family protein [unclassified Flagellimonas]|uniref:DUF6660 family protein n=1 Tax=Flagellimonas sp. MMG031 TaxID=3158549 RepID=A0AAU7MTV2_9FLAO